MNLGQLRTETKRAIGEDIASPVFFSDDDVDEAINEGYEEMADASEWYERTANLNLLSNRTYYDLVHALNDESLLCVKSIRNNITGRWLEAIGLRDLDMRTYWRWETINGPPEKYFVRGLFWLGTFPRNAQDGDVARISYAALPPQLTEDRHEPGIPRQFHTGLVEYAAADLLSQDGQTKKALARFQKYFVFEKNLVEFVNGRITLDKVNVLHG